MGKALSLLLVVAVIIAGLYLLTQRQAQKGTAPATGTAAASGSGPNVIDAKQVPNFLDQYKGKVVVMDFWATWCRPCVMAMPGVQKLHDEFAGRPVAVLGVNVSDRADPKAFMQSKGYTYGLILNGEAMAQKYNVQGIPRFVVLGVDGKTVIMDKTGYSPDNDKLIAQAIEKELSAKGL